MKGFHNVRRDPVQNRRSAGSVQTRRKRGPRPIGSGIPEALVRAIRRGVPGWQFPREECSQIATRVTEAMEGCEILYKMIDLIQASLSFRALAGRSLI